MINCAHITPTFISGNVCPPLSINKILTEMKLFQRRLHTRSQLAVLSDLQLQDIGISRQQAEQEANKPFWN